MRSYDKVIAKVQAPPKFSLSFSKESSYLHNKRLRNSTLSTSVDKRLYSLFSTDGIPCERYICFVNVIVAGELAIEFLHYPFTIVNRLLFGDVLGMNVPKRVCLSVIFVERRLMITFRGKIFASKVCTISSN